MKIYCGLLFLAISTIVLSACGNNSSGGGGAAAATPTLTSNQKQTVKNTNASMKLMTSVPSTVQSASAGTLNGTANNATNSANQSSMFSMMNAPSDSPGNSDRIAKMQKRLQDAQQKNLCIITSGAPVTGGNPGSASGDAANFSVTGDQCPVNLTLKYNSTYNSISDSNTNSPKLVQSIAVSLNYQVKDDEYRSYNDIDQAQMSGNIDLDGSSTTFVINAKFDESVHSQSLGKISVKATVNFSVNPDSKNGIVEMIYTYSDFVADLKATTTDGKTMHYYINGEEITNDEFMSYVDASPIKDQASLTGN